MNLVPSPELAELCGIHAGDGYLRNDGHRKEWDISGAVEESDYYDRHVVPLFEKVFKVKPKARFFQSRNTYGFVVRDFWIIEYLHSLGFPYGKKTFTVSVPDFVLHSRDLDIIYAFLRGVFDTDGCVSFQRKGGSGYAPEAKIKHAYPRITLAVCSKPLAEGVSELLMKTGFNFKKYRAVPKAENDSPKYVIVLRGYSALERWMYNIGFKNPLKSARYAVWKKFGFCPPHLSFVQTDRILNNVLNPNLFYTGPVV